jgi:hypothetical protein
MIPIVNVGPRIFTFRLQQLLAALSFAIILGGTCTLIGTSTGRAGVVDDRYPGRQSNAVNGPFDLDSTVCR